MKKNLVAVLIFVLAMSSFVGCTPKEATPGKNEVGTVADDLEKKEVKEDEKQEDSKFVDEDGVLTYLDTESSPFDGLGLKILITPGSEGQAKFVLTDLDGNEGADYFIFNYKDNTFEKYKFVSAMNSGFYYYYDLDKSELTKVEDKDHNDSTQGMKESNRWDGAVESTEEDIKTLEDYFKSEYGQSIKEYVKQ